MSENYLPVSLTCVSWKLDNMDFIRANSETVRGCPSDATVNVVKALNEPRPHGVKLHTLKSFGNKYVSTKVRASVDTPKQLLINS